MNDAYITSANTSLMTSHFTGSGHLNLHAQDPRHNGRHPQTFSAVDGSSYTSVISELAGILPLSALLDFVDGARALHIFQLRGRVPRWCWPITPSTSRIFLHTDPNAAGCCLDLAKASHAPMCLDGRYGDKYPMANAETIRMCLDATECRKIAINEDDQERVDAEAERRLQYLEVVTVRQELSIGDPDITVNSSAWVGGRGKTWWLYQFEVWIGYLAWTGLVTLSSLFHCWIALMFLVVVMATGQNIYLIHGRPPRKLGTKAGKSNFNRLVITADHENATYWRAFYGRSDIVNPLLNWPIVPAVRRSKIPPSLLLRVLVLAQWSLAIGAASLKGWDAFIITFWLVFCIFSINYWFVAEHGAKEWLNDEAQIYFKRYQVTLSSRRALLNTLIALNPDTFLDEIAKGNQITGHAARDINREESGEGRVRGRGRQHGQSDNEIGSKSFRADSLLWIDPILKRGEERTRWEEATRRALNCGIDTKELEVVKQAYQDPKGRYWWSFIVEGIGIANKIQNEAGISGHDEIS